VLCANCINHNPITSDKWQCHHNTLLLTKYLPLWLNLQNVFQST
jgi:hypothetical protein